MKKILSIFIALQIIISMAVNPAYAEETPLHLQVMHNIAEKYATEGLSEDANMLWLLSDMATYQELFPESTNTISDDEEQICLDKIIQSVKDTTAPAVLAKAIIALRSMGYDARHIVTDEFEEIDIVSRLTDMVDSDDSSLMSVYTLPYVVIALQQGEGYATDEQMDHLINVLLNQKEQWQDTTWGPDTATPVILALAPYYETNNSVKEAIDETIPIITALQEDSGIIGNAASSGLAIAALSAIGTDSIDIIKNEKTLIDGLLTEVSENLDGFMPMTNTFSTEQGFRGLVGLQLLDSNIEKRVYDFAGYPMNPARQSTEEVCTVVFQTTPADAIVEIDGLTPDADGKYKLTEGEYRYSVSKSGYHSKSNSFLVTSDDIMSGEEKVISVALNKRSSGGSIGSTKIRITVKVMTHDDSCDGTYTYKNNSAKYEPIVSGNVYIDRGDSVYDALSKALDNAGVEYSEDGGYVSAIGGLAEFDHSERSGWMFTVDGKHKDTGCRETKLTGNSTVIWYYTDDYTKERGSENYENVPDEQIGIKKFGLLGRNEDITYKEVINKGKTFSDVENCKYKAEIVALAERGIISGKTDEVFEPDSNMTRAEFTTIIVNALGLPERKGINFSDVKEDDWFLPYVKSANYYGIVKGVSATVFNPYGTITTEEASAMIERASKLCGIDTDVNILTAKETMEKFEDFSNISAWSLTSMAFCVREGFLNSDTENVNPQKAVTREQIAYMVYGMLGKAKLL